MSVKISIEPARTPEVEQLLARGDEFAHSLYPAEECFLLDLRELEASGVRVFVARDESGRALGMAALVEHPPPLSEEHGTTPSTATATATATGELKRMFVDASARGQGVGSTLLRIIEATAAADGINRIVLETGARSEAALALYRRHGYHGIPAFGPYIGSASSVCFAKDLVDTAIL